MFGSLEETERGRKLDPTPERIVLILLEKEKKKKYSHIKLYVIEKT